MSYLLIYTVTPTFEQSYSLLIESDFNEKHAKLWIHFGAMRPAFLEPLPWWKDFANVDALINKPAPELIEKSQADELFALIEQSTISPVPEIVAGLDGTSYEIEIQRGFNKAIYHWWSRLPREWHSFSSLVEKLETMISQRRKNA